LNAGLTSSKTVAASEMSADSDASESSPLDGLDASLEVPEPGADDPERAVAAPEAIGPPLEAAPEDEPDICVPEPGKPDAAALPEAPVLDAPLLVPTEGEVDPHPLTLQAPSIRHAQQKNVGAAAMGERRDMPTLVVIREFGHYYGPTPGHRAFSA
jgi:hypothetical protein